MALLLFAAPLLLGWFHVLSEETWFAANPHLSYAEVQRNPQLYEEEMLILAGQILEEETLPDGIRLEILCYSRNKNDRPVEPDPDCGNIPVETARVLDERLAAGRLVTLAAKVTGRRAEGKPVFSLVEIHLWPTAEEERRPIHPYPYRYGWGCDPWWHDPFCDPFHPPRYGPGWGATFGWGW